MSESKRSNFFPQNSITTNKLKLFLDKIKLYSEISNLGPIMRRYFTMNAFDGVLTALGLILGSFMLFIKDAEEITRQDILVPGIATTIAIGISGIIGAYLAETAERRKSSIEQLQAMAMTDDALLMEIIENEKPIILKEEDYYPEVELKDTEALLNGEEIQKVPVDPEPLSIKLIKGKDEDLFEEKSVNEKAESFASLILSLTDGLSPALGSIVGLLPFFFSELNLGIFISSFILEVLILFGLGVYLAKISEDSPFKYGMEMVLAGLFTAGISYLIFSIGGG